MSLTSRDCYRCGDGIFADDEHSCVREGKAVTDKGHFPDEAHWAILLFDKVAASVHGDVKTVDYMGYFSEERWKEEITKLTLNKRNFVAFKASKPARVTPNYSVRVDIDH